MKKELIIFSFGLLSFIKGVYCGNHASDALPSDMTWEQWHMKEEHNMEYYEHEKFFELHDKGNKGYFDKEDILTMYGLNREEVVGKGDGMGAHGDSEDVDRELADKVFGFVLSLLDISDDSKVSKSEYLKFAQKMGGMPDLGVGVGHHEGFEEEYELHHWNSNHRENDKEVNNVHKEDVEHDLLHHEHDIGHDGTIQRETATSVFTDDELESRILVSLIPQKYYNGPAMVDDNEP